jgi:hypothetical protein
MSLRNDGTSPAWASVFRAVAVPYAASAIALISSRSCRNVGSGVTHMVRYVSRKGRHLKTYVAARASCISAIYERRGLFKDNEKVADFRVGSVAGYVPCSSQRCFRTRRRASPCGPALGNSADQAEPYRLAGRRSAPANPGTDLNRLVSHGANIALCHDASAPGRDPHRQR